MAVSDYLGLVLNKLTGGLVPPRALLFFVVGATGLLVNLAVAKVGLVFGLHFALAQGIGGGRRHDLQLPDQQRDHLSRPATCGVSI